MIPFPPDPANESDKLQEIQGDGSVISHLLLATVSIQHNPFVCSSFFQSFNKSLSRKQTTMMIQTKPFTDANHFPFKNGIFSNLEPKEEKKKTELEMTTMNLGDIVLF
ncbi:hypothetical protein F2Q69_00046973 [Brassica cretica]|uniref:Uncharacterized protein n=1 Tax=Brassica cretica TaxID=69181 RepID=A0A8S9PLK3_BRACR|nr:hypothetical protein F2Q69_00046973 [Brassica cretica]